MIPIQREPTLLAALVGVAELLIRDGKTDQAATLLAFVLEHPLTREETHDYAFDLFDELEATICPRVILDAREAARTLTLDALSQRWGLV